jgi:hypothetical protein
MGNQFVGKNAMHLCKADMNKAVEFWLNNGILIPYVKVTEVTWKGGDNEFVVDFEPLEEEKKLSGTGQAQP